MSLPPRRILVLAATLALAAALLGAFAVRHLRDDTRRVAGRLIGCPPEEVDVEVLDGGDVERYRVQGCGTVGIMSCEPSDPVCFIVTEGP